MSAFRTTLAMIAALLGALSALERSRALAQPPRYDVVIAGGTLIDGTGKPGLRADVAVKDGRVVRIGSVPRGQAAETIDAHGLVVAPGFVDVHTHADDI